MGLRSTINWDDAYVSRVEAVVGKNKVVINAPIHFMQEVRLSINATCVVRFSSKRGYIRFKARVIEHIFENNMVFIVLRLSGEGSRTQQRSFFRYECSIPVKFYIVKEEEDPAEKKAADNTASDEKNTGNEPNDESLPDEKPYDGIILDISGGGVRIATRPFITDGVLLRIPLPLYPAAWMGRGSDAEPPTPEHETLIVFGKVRDRQEKKDAAYPNQYHVQFTALSKIDQERIIQFIYEQQRKSLQRR
jgi:c-di-GMP-binding flagellar brake protein YcgR